jgi:hypothetical protein
MDMAEVYRQPPRMLSDLRGSTGIHNVVRRGASAQIEQVLADLLGSGEMRADDGTVHRLFPVAISAEEGQELRVWWKA